MAKVAQNGDTFQHPTIQAALHAVMRDVGAIPKAQQNKFHKYQFRGIDDVMNALHSALVRHGVLIVPTVERREIDSIKLKKGDPALHAKIRVRYDFHLCGRSPGLMAADRSVVSATVEAEGIAQDDKATNKAMSAAYKYAMLQTFCIPTEDMDEADRDSPEIGEAEQKGKGEFDKNAPGSASKEQVAELRGLAKAHEDMMFGQQRDMPFPEYVEKMAGTISYAKAQRIIDGARKEESK